MPELRSVPLAQLRLWALLKLQLARPLRQFASLTATSPKGRGIGKEMNFAQTAKDSHFEESGERNEPERARTFENSIHFNRKDTIFMNENNLTHFDASGNAVMVDVSAKPVTTREATAHGIITMNAEAYAAVEKGTVKKGDVLGVARIAGIMATKRTSELIPLCHHLPLTKVGIEFRLLPQRQAVEALCTVKTSGVTGVEMEALTGVSTALLTIYDMCKAVDKGMELGEIHLVEKTGGKSGHYIRAEGGYV